MATAKRAKANLEFLLVKAELKGVSEEAGAMWGADLPRVVAAHLPCFVQIR